MTDDHQEFLADVAVGAIARLIFGIGTALAGIATLSLLVRTLPPATYGRFALLMAVVGFIASISHRSFVPTLVRDLSASNGASPGTIEGAFTLGGLIVVAGVAIVSIVTLMLDFSSGSEQSVAIICLLFVLIGAIGASLSGGVARANRSIALSETPIAVGSASRLLAVLIVTTLGLSGISPVLIGYGLAGLIMALVAYMSILKCNVQVLLTGWSSSAAKLFAVRAMPLAIQGFSTLAIARLDVLILGLFRPVAEIGAYEPVMRVTQQLGLLVTSLVSAQFLPGATRLFKVKGQELESFYVQISQLTWILAMPVLLLISGFPHAVFETLFGASFAVDDATVQVLLLGLATNIAFGLNTLTLIATGLRRELGVAGGITLAGALAVGLILIPVFGPIGAAISTTFSFVLQNVMISATLYRKLGISPLRRRYLLTLISGIALIITLGILAPGAGASIVTAGYIVIGAWIGWLVMLFAIGSLRLEELQPILRMRSNRSHGETP